MIKWIIISILGLIVLGYLGFDVRKAVDSPTTQTNLEYAKEIVSTVWNKYLSKPVTYVWDLFVKYVWELLIKKQIENLKNKFAPEPEKASAQGMLFSFCWERFEV